MRVVATIACGKVAPGSTPPRGRCTHPVMSAISLAFNAETLIVDATSISCTLARSGVWLLYVCHIMTTLSWTSMGSPQFVPPRYFPSEPLARSIFIVTSFCSVVTASPAPLIISHHGWPWQQACDCGTVFYCFQYLSSC